MISVYFGNAGGVEKVGEVESEDKLWEELLNDFLAKKGFKHYYHRLWVIETGKGPVTHVDFGSWSRFVYYGEEDACRKYFIEYKYKW